MPRPQLSHYEPPKETDPHPPWLQPNPHQLAQRLLTSSPQCLPPLLSPTPKLTLHRGSPGRGTAVKLGGSCIAEPGWCLLKGHASHLQQGGVGVGLGGDGDYALPGYAEQHISWVDCSSGDETPPAPRPGAGARVARGCSCWLLLLSAVRELCLLYLEELDTQALLPLLHR